MLASFLLCALATAAVVEDVSSSVEEENIRQRRGARVFEAGCLPYYLLKPGVTPPSIPSHCDVLPPPQPCGCPLPDDVKGAGKDVIIREVITHVSVRSRYVQVVVEAVIRNPTENVQTVDFDLEIPEQAFVSKFEIEVNGEMFKGVVEGKKKEGIIFSRAKRASPSAGNVAQKGANTFGTSLSVSLLCELTFRLTYEYVAERVKGKFNIPIKVVPTLPVITRRLNISIEDPSGIDCLEAQNYGDAKFDFESKYAARSTYKLNRSQMDDFVITFDLDQQSLAESSGTTLYDSKGFVFVSYTLPQSRCYAEGYNPVCTARSQTTAHPVSVDSIPKCVTFVTDRSGSMSGIRIVQTKEALILILGVLRNFDYAAIVEFNSVAEIRQQLTQVGPNLNQIITIVNSTKAAGGTNINDALLKGIQSLRGTHTTDVNCGIYQLVFLTDGEATSGVTASGSIISNYNNAVKQFRQATGKSIYTYSLGIGSSPDSSLLQTLAVQNRGFFRFISLTESVSSQLTEFYREIACPLLCGATLNYDKGNIANVTMENLSKDCYFDEEQVVFGGHYNPNAITKSEGDILKTIALSGIGERGQTRYNTQLIKIDGDNSYAERAYAYLRIRSLNASKSGLSDEAKAEIDASILFLALKYQLVTPLTSIIVVKPCKPGADQKTNTTTPPTTTPLSSTSTTPKTTRMDFDPHFVATSAAGHRLCYTVDGRDGEVYNILSDQAISVNGEIISFRYKGTRKTYFGTIVVKFTPPGGCHDDEVTFAIDSDKGLAFLNEGLLMRWGKAQIYEHKHGRIVSESKKQLQFVLSFPEYNIEVVISRFVRQGSFLGMAITNTAGLSPRAHGLIGQFVVMETNVTADNKMLQVRDKWYSVVPWQRLDPAIGKYVSPLLCSSSQGKCHLGRGNP